MAVILVASGQGLMAVSKPKSKAESTGRLLLFSQKYNVSFIAALVVELGCF
jgi:hypothetical protein